MNEIGNVIMGVFAIVAGLFGLYLAAHSVDDGIYVFGLLMFAFAVIFNFWLVKSHFDAT